MQGVWNVSQSGIKKKDEAHQDNPDEPDRAGQPV